MIQVMDALITALADPARWRLVELLAERPRSVGVLAQLAEARQPQTTKHLQTLERAGLVTSQRTGQRRIYALQSDPLRELAAALNRLADATDLLGGARESFDRHGISLDAERLAAEEAGWADGRRKPGGPMGGPSGSFGHCPRLQSRFGVI
jgi:DNA-binding transcriptional ArsR family regulator